MTPLEFFIWAVTGIVVATAIGNRRKGRPWTGFLLGLFLGWIGVIIIALIRPTHEKLVQRERERLQVEREARAGTPD
jgi:TctA family transporter